MSMMLGTLEITPVIVIKTSGDGDISVYEKNSYMYIEGILIDENDYIIIESETDTQ